MLVPNAKDPNRRKILTQMKESVKEREARLKKEAADAAKAAKAGEE